MSPSDDLATTSGVADARIVSRTLDLSLAALQWAVCALVGLSFWLSLQDRRGHWSLVQTPLYSIRMPMHGSDVFLSPRQKFIYYDAFFYCLCLCAALMIAGAIAAELHKLKTTPTTILAIGVALSALTYGAAIVAANFGAGITQLHLPGITP